MYEANELTPEQWSKIAERNILEIANGAEGMAEKLDKEGVVHELRYKLPPNPDMNKFIVKNMSKGKWADKIETSSTQININLTASYNEVNELMEKQRQKLIEERNSTIEAEVIE